MISIILAFDYLRVKKDKKKHKTKKTSARKNQSERKLNTTPTPKYGLCEQQSELTVKEVSLIII